MSFFKDSNRLDNYLQRINYQGNLHPTLATLNGLQGSHLFHVPFENLDIHRNVEIQLDIEKIYQKIVIQGRGGFCYELNGLFHELLRHLGFSVERYSGRVYSKENGYGHEFDHLFNWVTIDQNHYICDVGFGEFSYHPLLFELDIPQKDPRGIFIVETHEEDYYRISKEINGKFVPEHIFRKTAHPFEAYADMCKYHQTNPDSHFTKKRLISLMKPDGRVSITGNRLKLRNGKQVDEIEIVDETNFEQLLLSHFNVQLT